jgi:biopolymer transport protein ExbB/TolQ
VNGLNDWEQEWAAYFEQEAEQEARTMAEKESWRTSVKRAYEHVVARLDRGLGIPALVRTAKIHPPRH